MCETNSRDLLGTTRHLLTSSPGRKKKEGIVITTLLGNWSEAVFLQTPFSTVMLVWEEEEGARKAISSVRGQYT